MLVSAGRTVSDSNGEFFVYDAVISKQSYETCGRDPKAKEAVTPKKAKPLNCHEFIHLIFCTVHNKKCGLCEFCLLFFIVVYFVYIINSNIINIKRYK